MEAATKSPKPKGGVEPAPSSTWYLTQLTDRQRNYGIFLVEFEGDWKAAALKAGYSDKTDQASIEGGEAMAEYMRLVKEEIVITAGISASVIVRRLDRIATQAESEKEYGEALKANKMMGDYLGIWKTAAVTNNYNQNGDVITINGARPLPAASAPVLNQATIDALRANGMEHLIPKALEQAAVIDAEVFDDGS